MLINGTENADTIEGTEQSDEINAGGGNDVVNGRGGDDTINGGAGNDDLDGGAGGDRINGDAGDDTIRVSSGIDFVFGFAGSDTLVVDYSASASGVFTDQSRLAFGTDPDGGTQGEFSNGVDTSVDFRSIETFDVTTGSGNDMIRTGGGNDRIVLGAGNDTVDAGAGDDMITGGTGDDMITGGAGNDTALFNATTDGADRVDLGEGNDLVRVSGSAGNIRLTFTSAGAGNGNANDMSMPAGDGLPNVRFQAENGSGVPAGAISRFDDEGITFIAGAGQTFDVRDTGGAQRGELFEVVVLGTSGADVQTAVQADRPYYFNAGMGDDNITGGNANDFLVGGGGNDTLTGGAGNDTFLGGDGNDTLSGGTGNDDLDGGAGGDRINGDAGNDTIRVSSGIDFVFGDAGFDVLIVNYSASTSGVFTDQSRLAFGADPDGGTQGEFSNGVDTSVDFRSIEILDVTTGSGNDDIRTGAGNDRITLGAGNDTADAGAGNDIVFGGAGDDTIRFSSGIDLAFGDAGNDTLVVDFSASTAGVFVEQSRLAFGADPNGGTQGEFSNGVDTSVDFRSIETFDVTTGSGNDMIRTGGGNDRIVLGAGNDTVEAGAGDDMITGGAGNDTALFNVTTDGADRVDLGEGNDLVRVSGNAGNIRLTFTSAGVGNGNANDTDDLGNVRFQAENGSDALAGPQSRFDDEGITFIAGAGQTFDVRDTGGAQRGELFEVVVLGTSGADVQTAVQADRPYYFNAGMGDDNVTGGNANDFLVGGGGNDTLTGGRGVDRYIGGAGNDLFVFRNSAESNVASTDTIMDFMSGSDRIDLSQIDADVNTSGDQAFRFINANAFSANGMGGELRSTTDANGRSVLEGDITGDGVADFTVFVMDATPATPDPLVASDFIL